MLRVCKTRWVCALSICAPVSFAAVLLPAARLSAEDHPIAVPIVDLPLGLPPFSQPYEDPALVRYGAFLFQSSLLSSDRTLACASCHDPEAGLSGPSPVAIGVRSQMGRRHPPPVFNLYLGKQFMLDGRAASLEDQVRLPIESPTEMSADWPVLLSRLAHVPETEAALSAMRGQSLDQTLVARSLAAYIRTLVSGGSAFDRFYYGGDQQAIGAEAQQGLLLFIRKGRCSGCHLVTGYAAPLTDSSFHSTGIGFKDGAYLDVGRSGVTGKELDKGAFKTPTLRNVAARRYFMHDGSMHSLREVIDYYNAGGNRGAPNLDGRIRPLFLSETEIGEIIAFLETLNAPIKSYRARAN
jgi:cytochrome c peroxidase